MTLRLNKAVLTKHQEQQAEKKHTILLVDDEPQNLESISLILEKEYHLIVAHDGVEALEKISSLPGGQEVHLIIADQRMPRLTGVGLFTQTKDLLPDAVRMILSGFSDAEAMLNSINEGQVYKFLMKPIDPADLRVTVRRCLEWRQLRLENVQLISDLKQRVSEVENLVVSFEKFVPRQFLDRVAREGIQNVKNFPIGKAERGFVTILFADIRSFTTLSESMLPQDVLDFLNSLFRRLSEPVHRNQGFVDKFMGDAIMALFDSPEGQEELQVRNAVRAGVEMIKSLQEFNLEREKTGMAPVKIGIGIHTGPVIFGTVGVETRMDMTVLGYSVNVPARLEKLNKEHGSQIIVSSQTRKLMNGDDAYQWHELGSLVIRGRAGELVVYEVKVPALA
ncbi:MAG TPA: adenylate/guanylate cyclase domain-containing protein [Prosthecobacter sp.]|nr:adenylate/guanylate cyclase domain-containing protein [Prosthecobacter sp.]